MWLFEEEFLVFGVFWLSWCVLFVVDKLLLWFFLFDFLLDFLFVFNLLLLWDFCKFKCFIVIDGLFLVEFKFCGFFGLWSDVFDVWGEGGIGIDLVFEVVGDGFWVFGGVGFRSWVGVFFFMYGWVGILMGGGFEIVWLLCEVGVDVGRGGGGNGVGIGVFYFVIIYFGFFFLDNGVNEFGDLVVVFFFLNMEFGDNLVDFFFLDKGFKILMGFFFFDEGFEVLISFFFFEEGFKVLIVFFILDKRVEGFLFRGFFFLDKGFEGDLDLVGDELEM